MHGGPSTGAEKKSTGDEKTADASVQKKNQAEIAE